MGAAISNDSFSCSSGSSSDIDNSLPDLIFNHKTSDFECVSSREVIDQKEEAPTDLDNTLDDHETAEESPAFKRRRISAVRDYPCPQKNLKASFSEAFVRTEEVRDSTLLDEEYEDSISYPEEAATPKALEPTPKEAELEEDNISINSYGFVEDQELQGTDDKRNCTSEKKTTEEAISFEKGLNNDQLPDDAEDSIINEEDAPEKGTSFGENDQEPKGTIVLALMAAGAPNCPLNSQQKGASTSKTTKRNTKRRRRRKRF